MSLVHGPAWDKENPRVESPVGDVTSLPRDSEVTSLPKDSDVRKTYPLFSGLLAYFPAALARVSHHSYMGNQKHNPGKPLQHARNKSTDHADCIVRHILDAHEMGGEDRLNEMAALCWRSLALLQEEAEKQGAPVALAATFDRAPNDPVQVVPK